MTGETEFPPYLASRVKEGRLQYFCNNFDSYTLGGVHVNRNVLWDFEGPPPVDIYIARFHGTRARVEVRQGKAESFRPEVYIVANTPEMKVEVLDALRRKLKTLPRRLEGIGVEDRGTELRLTIPDRLRVGQEEHFAEVTRQFFEYFRNPAVMPRWEKSYMLAKYYVSTRGVELAQRAAEGGMMPGKGRIKE